MKAWYSPSYFGDFRLERASEGASCELVVHRPTEKEKGIVKEFLAFCFGKGWGPEVETGLIDRMRGSKRFAIAAKVEDAAPELVRRSKPEKASITAVKFSDGEIQVAEAPALAELVEVAKKDDDAAAVTVKRPTPSCPQCIPGSVAPASEVLLEFLTPEQHRDWSRHRVIEVEGGLTGHRYLVSHRHAEPARRWGRIAFDADDRGVLHFHDNSHPPEEEVLGAMLILQHREDWLRNEATCLEPGIAAGRRLIFRHVFKNPWGNIFDGIKDAIFTQQAGALAMTLPLGLAAHLEGHRGLLLEALDEDDKIGEAIRDVLDGVLA